MKIILPSPFTFYFVDDCEECGHPTKHIVTKFFMLPRIKKIKIFFTCRDCLGVEWNTWYTFDQWKQFMKSADDGDDGGKTPK